jgi:hypothetical protein
MIYMAQSEEAISPVCHCCNKELVFRRNCQQVVIVITKRSLPAVMPREIIRSKNGLKLELNTIYQIIAAIPLLERRS